MELYTNIKKYRKLCGWTQEELARRVGYVDRSAVSRVERGTVDISQSMILKFAEVFGVSPSELLGSDGTAAYMDQLTADEQRLIAYYRKLSETERAMITRAVGVPER